MWPSCTTPAMWPSAWRCGAVVGAAPADNVAPGGPRPRGRGHPAGRPHRPGRHRRGHRLLQEPQPEVPGAPWPAEVQKGNAPEERKLQRLFRDGEVTRLIKRCNDFGAGGVSRGHRRAGRRPGHRPGRGAQEVRRPGRHRACHLREPGAHGRGGGPRGRGDASSPPPPAENLEAYPVAVVTESPRMVMTLEGPDHRGPVPGLPEHQRRGEARRGCRAAAQLPERPRPCRRCAKPAGVMASSLNVRLPAGGWPSGSTPPSARPAC